MTSGQFVADDADLWNETLALDVLESAVTDVEQVHTHHANVHDNHGEFIPQWTRLCQPQDCRSTVHPCKIPPGANFELLAVTIIGDCCTSRLTWSVCSVPQPWGRSITCRKDSSHPRSSVQKLRGVTRSVGLQPCAL